MLLIVQASLWAFYALVPWLALKRWLARDPWPVQWALAVLAGTVSQAVLGFVWTLGIRQPARGEGVHAFVVRYIQRQAIRLAAVRIRQRERARPRDHAVARRAQRLRRVQPQPAGCAGNPYDRHACFVLSPK